jgi:hypothetical protein
MSKMGSHCSFGHLKHKLWPKEGPASLTSDQKKSGIDPIYLAADNVPHTIGKLLMRATTFLLITFRSKVFLQSYAAPKSRESLLVGFPIGEISGLPRGSPRRKKSFGCGPRGEVENIL